MTQRKTRTDSPGPGANPMVGVETLVEMNQRVAKAFAEANSHSFDRMMKVGEEWRTFVGRRMEQDRSVLTELAGCKTAPETVAVCTRFLETAMRAYSEEFERLAGLYAVQARETSEDVQHQIEELARPVVGSNGLARAEATVDA